MGLPGLAAQILFIAPLDAMRTIKKEASVGTLPLLPYSSMCLNGMIWMTYGAVLSNPAIWLPNAPAVIMGAYYWYTYNSVSSQLKHAT